mmetsp:Transcript_27169/g.27409  ORF Transcript_27169/g.27409 Transcript_27169/m.27409 type:complete len:408 (-) Transcript_27169:155-1378(-)
MDELWCSILPVFHCSLNKFERSSADVTFDTSKIKKVLNKLMYSQISNSIVKSSSKGQKRKNTASYNNGSSHKAVNDVSSKDNVSGFVKFDEVEHSNKRHRKSRTSVDTLVSSNKEPTVANVQRDIKHEVKPMMNPPNFSQRGKNMQISPTATHHEQIIPMSSNSFIASPPKNGTIITNTSSKNASSNISLQPGRSSFSPNPLVDDHLLVNNQTQRRRMDQQSYLDDHQMMQYEWQRYYKLQQMQQQQQQQLQTEQPLLQLTPIVHQQMYSCQSQTMHPPQQQLSQHQINHPSFQPQPPSLQMEDFKWQESQIPLLNRNSQSYQSGNIRVSSFSNKAHASGFRVNSEFKQNTPVNNKISPALLGRSEGMSSSLSRMFVAKSSENPKQSGSLLPSLDQLINEHNHLTPW